MDFNFSSGAIVNAGGAFLFLLAGIAILAVGRRTRLGLRLGAFATAFGLAYVVGNLVDYDANLVHLEGDLANAVAHLVPNLAAALCLGLLIIEILREVPPKARTWIAVLATGIGLGAGAALVVGIQLVEEADGGAVAIDALAFFLLVFVIEPLLLVLLAASGQAPTGGSLNQYKGRLMLGLAGGLFAVAIIMVTAASYGTDSSWMGIVLKGVSFVFGAGVAYAAWLVLRGRPPGAERFARRAFAAIILVGLIGSLGPAFPAATEDIGPYGILRSVGAALLVLAVVRYDLLGVPLPRFVVRRGPLAGGALAVLFIVAQVAQNFFSAKYGLLMGGVLAGTFVFAASPIQRAMERTSQQHPKPGAAASGSAADGYRAALRAAMRDGILTRREERHLAEVAMALGISPVQALDLRDEVERETA